MNLKHSSTILPFMTRRVRALILLGGMSMSVGIFLWLGENALAAAPSAPNNVIATPLSPTEMRVAWTDTSGDEVSFLVERSMAGSPTLFMPVTTAPRDATSAVATGLLSNTQYWFRVAATNPSGTSSAATSAGVYTLASTPTNVMLWPTTNTMAISWSGDASAYRVVNVEDPGRDSGWITTANYTFSVLACGTEHSFMVRGRNGDGRETSNAPAARGMTAPCTTPEQDLFAVNVPTHVSIGGATHTVVVLTATSGETSLRIGSATNIFLLKENVWTQIDTNDDGVADVHAMYRGLIGNKARLTFLSLVDRGEINRPLTINAGAFETSAREVHLFFHVADAEWITLSDTADFATPLMIPYVSRTTWFLSPGDGVKTVYARFYRRDGSVLSTFDTILLMSAPPPPHPTCPLMPGGAYRVHNTRAVWLITPECTKAAFTSPKLFFTYFHSWGEVKMTTQEILHSIATEGAGYVRVAGPKSHMSDGGVVKTTNNPAVFLLGGKMKHWIVTSDVFQRLQYRWSTIEDMADEFLQKYETGDNITMDKARLMS